MGELMRLAVVGEPNPETVIILCRLLFRTRDSGPLRRPGLGEPEFLGKRESLVVVPRRDRAYREMIVGKLREIEADARRPISFEVFEVRRDGVRPFVEA